MARRYGDDPVLHPRALRALENLYANTDTGVLDRAFESGVPLILGMAGGRQQKVTVRAVDTKSFSTDLGEHQKLDVLYALPLKAAKQFKRAVKRDAELAGLGRRPSPDVHQRLRISKMVFQRLIDESLVAHYTFEDGTIVPCRTRTFGFFEVNTEVKGGGSVTLFRHGLHRIVADGETLVDIGVGHQVQGR